MESPKPNLALYGGTNECARTNTILLPLSEVSTGAASLFDDCPFGQSKIMIVGHNFDSPSKWTAHMRSFEHCPFLRYGIIHLDQTF